MTLSEEVCSELEALEAIYAEDVRIKIKSGGGADVTLTVSPRTAHDNSKSYVEATLVISLCGGYPSMPPALMVGGCRGLGDKSACYFGDRLKQEIDLLQGEPLLYQVCEVAFETITALNKPEGECSICLETMLDGHPIDDDNFIRLGCYHIFHGDCFQTWWDFQQKSLLCQEQEMRKKAGHMAATRLLKLPKKSGNQFELECPVCRSSIHPSDLSPVKKSTFERRSFWEENHGETPESLERILPSSLYLALRRQQEVWNQRLAAQAECGGTVNLTRAALTLPSGSQQALSTTAESSTVLDSRAQSQPLVSEPESEIFNSQGTIQCRENGEMPRNGAENETSCGRLSSQIDKEINAHNFTEKRPTENISLQHMGMANCSNDPPMQPLGATIGRGRGRASWIRGRSHHKNFRSINNRGHKSEGRDNCKDAGPGNQFVRTKPIVKHLTQNQQHHGDWTRENLRRGQNRRARGRRGRGRRQDMKEISERRGVQQDIQTREEIIQKQSTGQPADECNTH